MAASALELQRNTASAPGIIGRSMNEYVFPHIIFQTLSFSTSMYVNVFMSGVAVGGATMITFFKERLIVCLFFFGGLFLITLYFPSYVLGVLIFL